MSEEFPFGWSNKTFADSNRFVGMSNDRFEGEILALLRKMAANKRKKGLVSLGKTKGGPIF